MFLPSLRLRGGETQGVDAVSPRDWVTRAGQMTLIAPKEAMFNQFNHVQSPHETWEC